MTRCLSFTSRFLLILCLLLISFDVGAQNLAPTKGPFIHLINKDTQVRIQAKGLVKPELEWRKLGQDKGTTKPMESDTYDFWEANLGAGAEEYRIVAGENSTPWYTIQPPKKTDKSFFFVAYGDTRSGGVNPQTHKELISQIKKESPAFVIHTGDLTQRGGSENHWQAFFNESLPLYSVVPFQPSIGNHDLSSIRYYAHYFDLGKDDVTYYTFQYGNAHFIALDSTLKFTQNSEQYKFLKDNLERLKGQWPIIIYFHHAAKSFSRHGTDSKVQKVLVPLFEQYGVALVVNGHDHGYQRFEPINGVQYIVTGGGGAPIYGISNKPTLKAFKESYHYVVFQVEDNIIRGTMKTKEGSVDDQFEIINPKEAPKESTSSATPSSPPATTKGSPTSKQQTPDTSKKPPSDL